MQGLFIDGRRPVSKKEVKEVVAAGNGRLRVESTSLFGTDFDGDLDELIRTGATVHFVGPDPYKSRKFYGTLSVKNGKVVVS